MPKKTNKPGLSSIASAPMTIVSETVKEEYEGYQKLFDVQPALVQRFIEAQARQLADAIVHNQSQAKFSLPDKVAVDCLSEKPALVPVSSEYREQLVGGMLD